MGRFILEIPHIEIELGQITRAWFTVARGRQFVARVARGRRLCTINGVSLVCQLHLFERNPPLIDFLWQPRLNAAMLDAFCWRHVLNEVASPAAMTICRDCREPNFPIDLHCLLMRLFDSPLPSVLLRETQP
jgi:hypothetical protein